MKRTYEFSHEIFAGFRGQIDLLKIENVQEIVDQAFADLERALAAHNLDVLLAKAKLSRPHCHIHQTLDHISHNQQRLSGSVIIITIFIRKLMSYQTSYQTSSYLCVRREQT